MKRISLNVVVLFILMSVAGQTGFAQEGSSMTAGSKDKKILVAYFSHTGNTREIANQIHNNVGGDIFEIRTVVPYTDDYDALVEKAREELASDFRPKLLSKVPNIDSYDVIFIGYPNWLGTYPMAVKAFLSGYDLSGKTIVPFCTHGGGGLGRSVSDLQALCKDSTILKGLAVRGGTVKSAQDEVSAWLSEINITERSTRKGET